MLFRLVSVSLLCLATALGPASAEKRVAFVVGDADYRGAPLINPTHDAADIAERLRTLGYEVDLGLDLDRRTLKDRIDALGSRAIGSDLALLFFAGQGLRVDQIDRLASVDADLAQPFQKEAGIDEMTDAIPDLIARFAGRASVTVAIFDVCRDDQFASPLHRGIAKADASRSSDLFVIFSSAPGQAAMDGLGGSRNSPFAEALLANVAEPNLSLDELVIRLRRAVMASTSGRQVPWNLSTLTRSVSLNPVPRSR